MHVKKGHEEGNVVGRHSLGLSGLLVFLWGTPSMQPRRRPYHWELSGPCPQSHVQNSPADTQNQQKQRASKVVNPALVY